MPIALLEEPKEVKVEKWDSVGLKNALDDVVRKIFTEDLKYSEDNRYVDTRLMLSTLGCCFSLIALVYDFLHPFPDSKNVLIICVISYFILMSILTLFMMYVEKDIIVCAIQKEASGLDPDSHWKVSTILKKFSSDFTLELEKTDGTSMEKSRSSFTKSVDAWVDVNGVILRNIVKEDVLKCVKSISPSDKKNQ